MHKRSTTGFTTLEMLLALVLVSPILILMIINFKTALKTQLRLSLEQNRELTYLKTINLLSHSIENLDTHRFKIPPRIHLDNFITFSDGSPNQVMSNSSNSAPALYSDALTSLEVAINKTLSIKAQLGAHEFSACPRFLSQIELNNKSFLGVSHHGLSEFTFTNLRRNGDCYQLMLYPTKSMSIASQAINWEPTFIIPIQHHYTLYVDKNSQLRLLSHLGVSNIENQPLLRGISRMQLKLRQHNSSDVFELAALIDFGTAHFREFNSFNHLARLELDNFLFNRP